MTGCSPLIFVSIASYRDPQLIPTIADCLDKASRPENLRFGICWQRDAEEPSLPFAGDSRFRILGVDWRESRGCCWARAEIMRLFDGENWFLQLDAHHRFVQGWDLKLLATAMRTGSEKPILTGLTPGFKPDDPNSFGADPLQTDFQQFTSVGLVETLSASPIVGWREHRDPLRARFVTAGFVFAPGAFVTDVPYDADLLYWGEEITLSIRAFTHGYDFFHPTEIMLWHQYAKNVDPATKRTRCFEADHDDWRERMHASNAKVQRFLREPFGCGRVRSFTDYEAYAGLSFQDRCASIYTWRHLEPPNPPLPADWAARRYSVQISFNKTKLPKDCDGLWVTFRDESEQVVHSFVYEAWTVADILAGPPTIATIDQEFAAEREPFYWSLMAHRATGWGRAFYGTVHSGVRSRGIAEESAA